MWFYGITLVFTWAISSSYTLFIEWESSSFTWFSLTYYSKKACVQPILHLYGNIGNYEQHLSWTGKIIIQCLQIWIKGISGKNKMFKTYMASIIAMEPCLKTLDPANSPELEVSVGWTKAFPQRPPWSCLALCRACPQQLRRGESFCSVVCFCPGWVPGVQCVHNPFYETDGNWVIANKSYGTSFSECLSTGNLPVD